jgi:chemotaxis protein CheZ
MLARLRELVTTLESGDEAQFEACWAELIGVRFQLPDARTASESSKPGNWNLTPINSTLFVSVAKLTRELHDAVSELRFDDHLSRLAGQEIPDACSRLDYVVKVTEDAAHRTLDLVEQGQRLVHEIDASCDDLASACQRAQRYAISPYALSGLVCGVDEVRASVKAHLEQLRSRLSQLAQAQEYQDLSGQVIRRVTQLVRGIEQALIALLRAAGTGSVNTVTPGITPGLQGPAIPGVTLAAVNQDDADALLAELGF